MCHSAACHASHPRLQAGWEKWRCPVDGCHGELVRDWRAAGSDPACNRLHSDDQFRCTSCQWTALGNFLARLMVTRGANVMCSHCCGRGYVAVKPVTPARKKRRPDTAPLAASA